METRADNTFQTFYENLPPALGRVVKSFPLVETSYNIGRKHAVDIEKIGQLTEEVFLLIAGINEAKDFIDNLTEILSGNKEKATVVADEVNQRIFLPIRTALKVATSQPLPKPVSPPPSQPKPTPPPAPEAPKGPQPLIIHPLPRELDKEEGRRKREEGFVRTVEAAKVAAPTEAPKPAMLPPLQPAAGAVPPSPSQLSPKSWEGKPAPMMGPLEVTPVAPAPPMAKAQFSPPSKPAAPPQPASAYERAKQGMEKEFEVFRRTQETKEIPGAVEKKPPPPSGGAISPYIITKEQLQKMVSEKRAGDRPPEIKPESQPPAPTSPSQLSQPGAKPAERKTQGESWEGKPLKLPPQKIPKPQAPEQYMVDPYREPVE